jgi:hypothetical protein
MYRIGEAEGEKKGYAKAVEQTTIKRLQAVVYIDPAKQGAYDQPSPNTEPDLQRRLQARRRQEALQVEIRREHERKQAMKGYVSTITGKHDIRTDELPHMPGELQRLWQTGQLQVPPAPGAEHKDDMKKFLNCETNELPTATGDLARSYTTRKLKPINLQKPAPKPDPEDGWTL